MAVKIIKKASGGSGVGTPPPKSSGYKVGYKHPPLHTRFKKGISGNPRGRSKGAKGFAQMLAEELGQLIEVTESGRRRRISKQRVFLKALLLKALNGEAKAMGMMLKLLPAADEANRERHRGTQVDSTDLEVLEAFREMVRAEKDEEPTP